MSIFCPPDIFDNCNPRTVIQEILNRLCTAECTWDNVRVVVCGTPQNTWDDLWNCDIPPVSRIVIENCGASSTLYYFDTMFGIYRPVATSRQFRVIQNCAAPTVPADLDAAFAPYGVPPEGAIVYVHCGVGPDRKYYWNPATANWQVMEDITSRSIGTGGITGNFCTNSGLGISMPFNIGLPNPCTINIPNIPQGWSLWLGFSGYFHHLGCNGFVDVYVDAVLVNRYYFFIAASTLSNPDMTSPVFNFAFSPGLHTVEFRAGVDTTINPCNLGTDACWNNFAVQMWLEPSDNNLPTEW